MPTPHTIHLHPLGKELTVNHGTPLIDVLHEYGVEFPCGGKGNCGKCKVKVLEGHIETNEVHRSKIKKLGLPDNWYLACHSICTSDLTLEIEQFSHFILADESTFKFTPQEGYGVAVDLGTTTLVAQLVNLQTAEVMAVETMLNPQVKFGADLISRIQHALDGGAPEMTQMIRRTIGQMVASMLKKKAVPLARMTLVGNTAMQLLFSGCDVTPLSAYPFETNDLGEKLFQAKELGWDFEVSGGILFYPSIGSFVGSDILAGICATGLHEKETYTALIDLGTNGEIVVGNKEQIVCASTAAGPAFEGANISMGMRAVTGAISSLTLSNGTINPDVIGNAKPRGICGSALIDAVAIFKQQELIGMFGEISSGEERIQVAGNVFLTQKDINEFLLAKAAIAAGLQILSRQLGIEPADIHEIYIAGGFGSYINLEHVTQAGMIATLPEKIHKMGNTALIGAKMFLFAGMQEAENIRQKTTHVNLEGAPDFQDIYVDKMMLT